MPSAVEAQSLNHWTCKEVPLSSFSYCPSPCREGRLRLREGHSFIKKERDTACSKENSLSEVAGLTVGPFSEKEFGMGREGWVEE